jgi:deoxyribodipyrimidine photolyase-related protein
MKTLRLILGDQLSHDISALEGLNPASDTVSMMEVAKECTYAPHHVQKIVLALSAMRHFAAEMQEGGVKVDYLRLDDPANPGDLTGAVERAVKLNQPDRIIVTESGEWRVKSMMESWRKRFGVPLEIRGDGRFFASIERFSVWACGRRSGRMEHFYREMRRDHNLLMDNDRPAGGSWTYDVANRKRLPAGVPPPERM